MNPVNGRIHELRSSFTVIQIALLLLSSSGLFYSVSGLRMSLSAMDTNDTNIQQHYTISKTWDGDKPVTNAEINLTFSRAPSTSELGPGLLIDIDAPFFNDPVVPQSVPVGSTDKLWNYEVVEVFFLSESEDMYLETEFAPSGHYLLLQLDTKQTVLKYQLPLNNYTAEIDNSAGRWHGRAIVPGDYLPKNVTKFNAYAIHKSDPERVYMSLFPATKAKYSGPNFHRLNYFRGIDLSSLLLN